MDHLCINISFICVQNTVLTRVEPTDKRNASQCQSGMSQTQRIVIMYVVPAVLLSFPTFLCLSAEQRCHSQTESVASVRGGLLTTLRHRNDTWRHSVDTTNISHTDYFARTSHDAWRHSVDTTNTSHTDYFTRTSHDAWRLMTLGVIQSIQQTPHIQITSHVLLMTLGVIQSIQQTPHIQLLHTFLMTLHVNTMTAIISLKLQ